MEERVLVRGRGREVCESLTGKCGAKVDGGGDGRKGLGEGKEVCELLTGK